MILNSHIGWWSRDPAVAGVLARCPLPKWRSVTIARGYLSILTVEHDFASPDVPKISKLTPKAAES